MTTYEEISKCPEANYRFWTERARLSLVCMRSFNPGADKNLALSGFRKNMANRRNKTFLE